MVKVPGELVGRGLVLLYQTRSICDYYGLQLFNVVVVAPSFFCGSSRPYPLCESMGQVEASKKLLGRVSIGWARH